MAQGIKRLTMGSGDRSERAEVQHQQQVNVRALRAARSALLRAPPGRQQAVWDELAAALGAPEAVLCEEVHAHNAEVDTTGYQDRQVSAGERSKKQQQSKNTKIQQQKDTENTRSAKTVIADEEEGAAGPSESLTKVKESESSNARDITKGRGLISRMAKRISRGSAKFATTCTSAHTHGPVRREPPLQQPNTMNTGGDFGRALAGGREGKAPMLLTYDMLEERETLLRSCATIVDTKHAGQRSWVKFHSCCWLLEEVCHGDLALGLRLLGETVLPVLLSRGEVDESALSAIGTALGQVHVRGVERQLSECEREASSVVEELGERVAKQALSSPGGSASVKKAAVKLISTLFTWKYAPAQRTAAMKEVIVSARTQLELASATRYESILEDAQKAADSGVFGAQALAITAQKISEEIRHANNSGDPSEIVDGLSPVAIAADVYCTRLDADIRIVTQGPDMKEVALLELHKRVRELNSQLQITPGARLDLESLFGAAVETCIRKKKERLRICASQLLEQENWSPRGFTEKCSRCTYQLYDMMGKSCRELSPMLSSHPAAALLLEKAVCKIALTQAKEVETMSLAQLSPDPESSVERENKPPLKALIGANDLRFARSKLGELADAVNGVCGTITSLTVNDAWTTQPGERFRLVQADMMQRYTSLVERLGSRVMRDFDHSVHGALVLAAEKPLNENNVAQKLMPLVDGLARRISLLKPDLEDHVLAKVVKVMWSTAALVLEDNIMASKEGQENGSINSLDGISERIHLVECAFRIITDFFARYEGRVDHCEEPRNAARLRKTLLLFTKGAAYAGIRSPDSSL